MLRADNLTVSYGDLKIVDDVSFKIEEHQWLMITGPNGAGKSTIIKALTQGVPYSGRAFLHNKDMSEYKTVELARHIGVLSQNYNVGYSFTVEEVVRLGRYAWSRGPLSGNQDKSDEMIEYALEITGMSSFRNHSVLTLSGGELQRTFLAQLFAQDPELLILDEPTNHLDLIYQKQMFELIMDWMKHPGHAVISVVHDLSLAKAFGTHALLLNKGKIAAAGETQEVFTDNNLTDVYSMDVYAWMDKLSQVWQPQPKGEQ